MLHIIVKKINSLHLNLYLTSDAPASLSDTASSVASSSGTSLNTKNQPIIAYIHDLCDLRASANNNLYFNLKLQTKEESFRAVCYSPDKHKIFKAKAETASS